MTWGKRQWACSGLGMIASWSYLAIKRFGFGAPNDLIDVGVTTLVGFAVSFLAMHLTRPKAADRPLIVEDFYEGRQWTAAQMEAARGMRAMSEEEMKARDLRDGPLMANYKPTPEEMLRMRNTNSDDPAEPIQTYDRFPEPKSRNGSV